MLTKSSVLCRRDYGIRYRTAEHIDRSLVILNYIIFQF